MEKSAHKLELLRRIADLEKKQLWHLDVEDDPETYPLMPDQIDYLNEKISNKIKNKNSSNSKLTKCSLTDFLESHAQRLIWMQYINWMQAVMCIIKVR